MKKMARKSPKADIIFNVFWLEGGSESLKVAREKL